MAAEVLSVCVYRCRSDDCVQMASVSLPRMVIVWWYYANHTGFCVVHNCISGCSSPEAYPQCAYALSFVRVLFEKTCVCGSCILVTATVCVSLFTVVMEASLRGTNIGACWMFRLVRLALLYYIILVCTVITVPSKHPWELEIHSPKIGSGHLHTRRCHLYV